MPADDAGQKGDCDFKIGDAVYFNYRSAKDCEGDIVEVIKQAKTSEKTTYGIMPLEKYIHPGEKVPIHRTGAHLRHRTG